MPDTKLILASTSAIRQMLLKNAGVDFTCQSPKANEDEYKLHNRNLSPQVLALALADLKATSIETPNALVIGADQTLSCNGVLFNKTKSLTEAKICLQTLRSQTHTLHSAISMSLAGVTLFSTVDSAHLTMRNFSDGFLEDYLNNCGPDILNSVGCYQLENSGAQLFEKIEGDYFTILGFPLLPCLAFLRQMKFLKT